MEININLDGVLLSANNLSDVASAAASRINIGAEPLIAAGVNTQYWRGDKTWQTLNTTAVSEGINLYYTQARFDTAFAAKTTTNLNEGINLYFTEDRTRDTDLAGLSITGGSITATDSVLSAFGKLQNQIAGLLGGAIVQGVWNATTNTPALASGVGTTGYYYVVNVAGSTNLDGITDWKVGDWAIFINGAWNKVDNTDAVSSVNGYVGAVSLVKADIGLGNVENTALSTWAGSTNITTLGTIGTGTWNATAIGVTKGGTGLTALGSASQQLRVNAGGTALEYFTPTTGISIGDTIGNSPVTGSILMNIGTTLTQSISYRAQQATPFSTAFGFESHSSGSFSGVNNTSFGYQAGKLITTGTNNTLFGFKAGQNSVYPALGVITGSRNTIIGTGLTPYSTSSNDNVLVGWGMGGASLGNNNVGVGNRVIGDGYSNFHSYCAALGNNAGLFLQNNCVGSTSLGAESSANYNYSVALGYGARAEAANTCVIGGKTSGSGAFANIYFNGETHTSASSAVINACGGSGTNNAGANLTLAAGKGTGAGTPGTWSVQTSATLGTGTTLQSLVTRLTISGGAVTTDASTATWADKLDFVFNTGTGTKFGTATSQKLAFWNATPIVQPSSANQAALTNSTGGTYNGTLVDVGAVFSQANINDNFTDICTLLNEVRNVLVNTGLMKGSA